MNQPAKSVEVKFAFATDFNEIYQTKKGSYLAMVDGKWHKCSGSPYFEPDYAIANPVIVVKEFTEIQNEAG